MSSVPPSLVSSCARCSLLRLHPVPEFPPAGQRRWASGNLDRLLGSCDFKLRRLRRDDIYLRRESVNPNVKPPYVMFDGYHQKLLSFRSYDFLGLSSNAHVVSAFNKAMVEYHSMPSVQRVPGHRKDILELEEVVAEFHQREACLAFSSLESGMDRVFSVLFGADDVIFCDDGVAQAAKNVVSDVSGVKALSYRNCDIKDLETKLKTHRNTKGAKVILTEGFYPNTGRTADLRKLLELGEAHDALVILDDSLAIGVLGDSVRGLEDNLHPTREKPFLTFGSFEFAFGQHSGGYVVGPSLVLDTVRAFSKRHLQSLDEVLHPGVVAGAKLVLENAAALKQPAAELRERSSRVKEELCAWGGVGHVDQHPIIPVLVGEERKASAVMDQLMNHRVAAIAMKYPLVPRGAALLNLLLTRLHTEEQLKHMMDTLKAVCRRNKVPSFSQLSHLL